MNLIVIVPSLQAENLSACFLKQVNSGCVEKVTDCADGATRLASCAVVSVCGHEGSNLHHVRVIHKQSPRLHLSDQKSSKNGNIVKYYYNFYYYNLQELFYILIHFKM